MANWDVTISKPASATGGVTFGNVGATDLPTDAGSQLPVTYKPMGYVSQDGITLTEDNSDEDIIVWGGLKVRKVRSDHSASIALTLYSTRDVDVLKAVFGDRNVESSGTSITVKHGADMPEVRPYTIETTDESGFKRRFAIPKGQLSVSGDRSLTHSSADGLECTIECLADAEGVNYYEYTELPAVEGAEPGAVPGAGEAAA